MGTSPTVTTRASLNRLLAAAQEDDADDSPAMHEIVCRFEPLTRRIARYTTSDLSLQDDCANAARLALVRAVRGHTAGRPGFPAYAAKFMRGAAHRERLQWSHQAQAADERVVSTNLDEENGKEPGYEHVEDEVVERLAPWGDGDFATAVAALSPQQKAIVELRYVDDAPLEEIAEATGTTRSAVHQRLATVHRQIALQLAA
jgi:RNA polymerase sigma factor (sigma-70 family)